jgi:hypothetical protein
MQVCLPKHNYKLDNNLLTVEPRALDPHCFDADLAQDADPDPDPGGGGRSAKNVHPPWQNPRYAPGNHYFAKASSCAFYIVLFLLSPRRSSSTTNAARNGSRITNGVFTGSILTFKATLGLQKTFLIHHLCCITFLIKPQFSPNCFFLRYFDFQHNLARPSSCDIGFENKA